MEPRSETDAQSTQSLLTESNHSNEELVELKSRPDIAFVPVKNAAIETLRYLLRFKYLLFFSAILSASIATYVAFMYLPNMYTASVNAVPPKKAGAMDGLMGSVSTALKDIGLTRVMGKKSDSYEFIVLLKSRTMYDSLITSFDLYKVYDIPKEKSNLMYEELDERVEIINEVEGNYTISVTDTDPQRAANMANYCITLANTLALELERRENSVILQQFEGKINSTNATISLLQDSLAKYSKASLMYSPMDQAKVAATAVAEAKSAALQAEVKQQILTATYGDTDPITIQQQKLASLLRSKASDVENRPGFIGNFSLRDAPAAAFKYLRLYTELETMMKMKAFLMPSFEQTKLDQIKQSYSLYVLDNAIPPVKKSGPKRSLIILGAFFAAPILSIVILLLIRSIASIKRILNQQA